MKRNSETCLTVYAGTLREDIRNLAKTKGKTFTDVLHSLGVSSGKIADAQKSYAYYNGENPDGLGYLRDEELELLCSMGLNKEKYIFGTSVPTKLADLTPDELSKLIYKAVYSAVKHAWENEEEENA